MQALLLHTLILRKSSEVKWDYSEHSRQKCVQLTNFKVTSGIENVVPVPILLTHFPLHIKGITTPNVNVSVSVKLDPIEIHCDAWKWRGIDFQASQCISMASNLTLSLTLGVLLCFRLKLFLSSTFGKW